ncbi:MAG TPA: hypothetical protein VIC70_03255, partial [Gaiellaceae bacterium]
MSTIEAPAAGPIRADDLGTDLVARARAHKRRRLAGFGETVALALGGAFLAAATAAAVFLPAVRSLSPLTAVIAVATYAVVSRVGFEVGNGFVLPTQLALVPMLFALPPRSVPLLVAAASVLGQAPDLVRRRFPVSHVPLLLANATHSLGPATVLALTAGGTPAWGRAPIYAGALGTQFVADFVPSTIWARARWHIPLGQHARSTRVPVLVDTALAPIGLVVAIATAGHSWGVLLVLPLVALLKVFASERQVRIDHALELSTAYRGTAMLLGDVIEADDEYTGAHSRDVVDLVLAVADKLALDSRQRQRA